MGSAVFWRIAAIATLSILIAGCQPDEIGYGAKHQRPVSMQLRGKMNDLGMQLYSPILLRIFKEESTLEVWKRKRDGRFALLTSYEICKWSGKLGPKFKEGDRQAPEGFYEIYPAQMNPNSNYHLAFNLGFPNPYDRAHGRTGSHLMVHGACSSRGCYAMTDEQVQEIYSLARDSFRGGQRAFQVQAFPFRMTPKNLARHDGNEHMEFWKMLKEGHDHFEITKTPPKIDYCGKRYVFNAVSENADLKFNARAACPVYTVPASIAVAVASKKKRDADETVKIIAELQDQRRRDEEWKKRQTMIAEALGAKEPTETKPTAVAAAGGTAGTLPPPKPSLALARETGSGVDGFFSGLFGADDAPAGQSPQTDVASTATTPDGAASQSAGTSTAVGSGAADAETPPADIPASRQGNAEAPVEREEPSVLTRWLDRLGGNSEAATAPAPPADVEPRS